MHTVQTVMMCTIDDVFVLPDRVCNTTPQSWSAKRHPARATRSSLDVRLWRRRFCAFVHTQLELTPPAGNRSDELHQQHSTLSHTHTLLSIARAPRCVFGFANQSINFQVLVFK